MRADSTHAFAGYCTMWMDYICHEVARVEKRYGERDPYRLCEAMGITLKYEPMGTFPDACKGFFFTKFRKAVISLNSDLPEHMQRIVLAHELGHAVLHRKVAGVSAFHDFALFANTSRLEYEANIFAADFLLKDDEVLDLLNDDMFFFSAASKLCVPPELLDFKFRILKRKGHTVMDPPLMANGDFLMK